MLTISEIFPSIQGEGRYSGCVTTFIRLFGCNLHCLYCDTEYANKGKKKRASLETIVNTVNTFDTKYICITGGEPLLQEDTLPLVYELTGMGKVVSIETNGCVPIEKDHYKRSFSYTMDVKCPSSGQSHKNVLDNLYSLQNIDDLKFVISDYNDYMFAKGILKQYPILAGRIFFSPMFGEEGSNAEDLAEWMVTDKLKEVQLGLQIHKLIGVK